ncbi:MAG: nucleoside monophosphate kinase [Patescibacteria group bacterium]
MNIVVILFGPPGSGKGTQAQLLADKLNLFHFDTGKYIRDILYNPELINNAIIKSERRLNESGQLNTSSWIFKIVSKKIKKIDKTNKGVVLSGSPRTIAEAFGQNSDSSGLMNILEKDYGKKNIFIFVLKIPAKESIKRNTHRLNCSVCRTPVLNISKFRNIKISACPFCGGKMNYRFDDKKEVIIKRLKEYENQSQPIIKEMKRKNFKIITIDGTPLPYKVHNLIMAKIVKFHK